MSKIRSRQAKRIKQQLEAGTCKEGRKDGLVGAGQGGGRRRGEGEDDGGRKATLMEDLNQHLDRAYMIQSGDDDTRHHFTACQVTPCPVTQCHDTSCHIMPSPVTTYTTQFCDASDDIICGTNGDKHTLSLQCREKRERTKKRHPAVQDDHG